MSNITISIADKCGLDHAGGAFIIDETGTILVINMNVKEWGGGMAALPVRFDMSEYNATYAYIKTSPHRIERTDIGYYAADGMYHPADAHMRRVKQDRLIAELIEHLDNTSASLETMLAYLEGSSSRHPMPPHDHKQRNIVCGNARLFLLQFKTPEEDEEQDEGAK